MQPSMNPKTAFTNTCMETKDTTSVVEKCEVFILSDSTETLQTGMEWVSTTAIGVPHGRQS